MSAFLQRIHEDWAIDCKISNKLDECSKNTPALHAKYMKTLGEARIRLKSQEQKHLVLLKKKFLYYNGKMSKAELLATGWNLDPFNGLKIMKGDMDYYYDADPEIQQSVQLVEYWKIVVDTLKDIIDNLKWRHSNIKNIIEWKRFEDGQ